MKRWALVTVGLYVLIMAALAIPLVVAAFGEWPTAELLEGFRNIDAAFDNSWFFVTAWVWIGVMALCQLGLLVVPVRVAGGRSVSRRWIVWPVLAACVLLAVLFAAMGLAVWETVQHTSGTGTEHVLYAIGAVGVVWLGWAFLFGFYTGNREPKTFLSRLVKFLIAGSILELLVAVPTHVLARVRGYCCAGFLTFWGLAAGLSVMLVAFGPATFLLFARRYASVRRPRRRNRRAPPPSPPPGP